MADNGNGKVLTLVGRIVIPLVAMAVGAAITYGTTRGQIDTQIKSLCDARADHENRIRGVETTMTRLDERTARMEKDIAEIKEAVR